MSVVNVENLKKRIEKLKEEKEILKNVLETKRIGVQKIVDAYNEQRVSITKEMNEIDGMVKILTQIIKAEEEGTEEQKKKE